MDIRPLIHFWLNKPNTWDDGECHKQCRMGVKTFGQVRAMVEMVGVDPSSRFTTVTWGDPNSLLDLWIDIDKCIANCDSHETLMLEAYIRDCLLISEDDWELWPEGDVYLQDIFDAL